MAEDSHNKENINVLREFILHQQNIITGDLRFTAALEIEQLITDSYLILSLCFTVIPLLTKLVWSRWLDISLVPFFRFFMDQHFISEDKNTKKK